MQHDASGASTIMAPSVPYPLPTQFSSNSINYVCLVFCFPLLSFCPFGLAWIGLDWIPYRHWILPLQWKSIRSDFSTHSMPGMFFLCSIWIRLNSWTLSISLFLHLPTERSEWKALFTLYSSLYSSPIQSNPMQSIPIQCNRAWSSSSSSRLVNLFGSEAVDGMALLTRRDFASRVIGLAYMSRFCRITKYAFWLDWNGLGRWIQREKRFWLILHVGLDWIGFCCFPVWFGFIRNHSKRFNAKQAGFLHSDGWHGWRRSRRHFGPWGIELNWIGLD